MIAEEVLGKSIIQFKNKTINLPYKIDDVIIKNNFIIVSIEGYLPDDISKKSITEDQSRLSDADLKIYNEHASIVNQNIMCFDLDGNLKWKIPKAYTEEVDQNEINRVGHPYLTTYIYMELESENVLMARTAYGNRIRVNVADGALLSRTGGSK
jgi:hypothetical protein